MDLDVSNVPWKESVISVDQFTRDHVDTLFELAKTVGFLNQPLSGKVLANLFYEPSTRTSSSFHSAMVRLGGSVIPINEVHYSSVSKGETLEDTVRTLECYADAIVLRHSEGDAAMRAWNICNVPIINAGNGVGEHPTQALLDLYTILQERGCIDGLNITLMGDLKYGRTVHSLSKLLRLYDVNLSFVSPEKLGMPEEYVMNNDGVFIDLQEVITTTDILYVTRVQRERMADGVTVDMSYGVSVDDMNKAKDNMVLMHPLPRVGEIPVELDSDPRSAYFRQMKYGLYVRMALLYTLLG